ncbi:hypothetical protein [Streptomyces sp. NPDC052042]|uniref:hypothetical protein n=1 Tax=Streptomyces sp. NPDC052042 TaxID=3365683 RepID=UPI0037D2B516
MSAPTLPALVMVERAYRGAVESQFADVLYIVRELNRQLGGVHLAFRGQAVTYAVEAPGHEPVLTLGSRTIDTLPDPRRSVRTLLDEGVSVWAEQADVDRLGASLPDRLIPGVRTLRPGELAASWPTYTQVWFM